MTLYSFKIDDLIQYCYVFLEKTVLMMHLIRNSHRLPVAMQN